MSSRTAIGLGGTYHEVYLEPLVLQNGKKISAFPIGRKDLLNRERVESSHSWRYGRLVLLGALGGLVAFLVATQPGLQSGMLAVASGITGGLTALLKLRDAIGGWLSPKKVLAER